MVFAIADVKGWDGGQALVFFDDILAGVSTVSHTSSRMRERLAFPASA